MVDSYHPVARMQNISATKHHVKLDKWTNSLGVSQLVMGGILSWQNTESQKIEEPLPPGWISIMDLILQRPGRVTPEESAAVGSVNLTGVEQQSLQTETQLGVRKSVKEWNIICIRLEVHLGLNILSIFFIFRGENDSQLQSDEEDLEPPLPLRSDDEWPHYRPLPPPHHYMHNYCKKYSIKYI